MPDQQNRDLQFQDRSLWQEDQDHARHACASLPGAMLRWASMSSQDNGLGQQLRAGCQPWWWGGHASADYVDKMGGQGCACKLCHQAGCNPGSCWNVLQGRIWTIVARGPSVIYADTV